MTNDTEATVFAKKEALIKSIMWREKNLEDRKTYLRNLMQDSKSDFACQMLQNEIDLISKDLCSLGE